MLGCLGFLLSIKSDRRFPFPETIPEPIFQLLLLPLTILFFIAFICFLKPRIISRFFPYLNRISSLRLAIATSLIFLGAILVLLVIQDIQYEMFEYSLIYPITFLTFAMAGIIFGYIFIRDYSSNRFFFYGSYRLYWYILDQYCLLPTPSSTVRYAPSYRFRVPIISIRDYPLWIP